MRRGGSSICAIRVVHVPYPYARPYAFPCTCPRPLLLMPTYSMSYAQQYRVLLQQEEDRLGYEAPIKPRRASTVGEDDE